MAQVEQAQVQVQATEKMAECEKAQDMSKDIQGLPEASLPVEEIPVGQATPEAKNRKRNVQPKASGGLEAIAAKVKRFREEADQAEVAIDEEVKKLEEVQARISTMRSEAADKRAAADRASKEYIKKQCEMAIAELEADVPQRPPNAFITWRNANSVRGAPTDGQNKELSEKWANLAPEEKKKCHDRFAEANKRFHDWGKSEEGQKNLRERNALIQKAKSAGAEELGRAIEALESGKTNGATKVTPAKRASDAVETPTKDMPLKQRRVSAGKTTASAKEPFLDESILEEASKAGLAAQLANLAARSDILTLGKSPQQLLDALRSHDGMVNAAKRALLSA